jgi:hypothetical protein
VADALKKKLRYQSAAPMRLYDPSRVEEVEASDDFAAAKAGLANRRAGAAKAVATKRNALRAYIEGLVIDVPSIPFDDLVRLACESHNEQARIYGRDDLAWPGRNDIAKICVNHIRHRMTDYEAELSKIAGKVGTGDAYLEIRSKIFDAIADTYPDLWDECSRQEEEGHARAGTSGLTVTSEHEIT